MKQNRTTSIGTDFQTVFPPEPEGDVKEVVCQIRKALSDNIRINQEVLSSWISILEAHPGKRSSLEIALCFLAAGNVPSAISQMSELLKTERDFVLLAIQNLIGLEDPLAIPAMSRSLLREKMRPLLAKEFQKS